MTDTPDTMPRWRPIAEMPRSNDENVLTLLRRNDEAPIVLNWTAQFGLRIVAEYYGFTEYMQVPKLP